MEKHQKRTDLAGEHILGDWGQLLLFFLFMGVWIADCFFLHFSDMYAGFLPPSIRIILSAIILIVGGYLAYSGMHIVFGEIRAEPIVIKKGVFAVIRHPIYLGAILFYAGMLMINCSLGSAFIWLIIILFYHFISLHEEKLLLKKYGRDYEQYMREVPMWIPGIKKRPTNELFK
ncbi:isoprenylcysteine carboxylmethyltransferase family protein [candidate division KSB1 bacterium]|nr:isoprenylcysteine carboxylmethyltransferase family protein [candidate division KSB1 bacterium]